MSDLQPTFGELSVIAPVQAVTSGATPALPASSGTRSEIRSNPRPKKIWIDLDNSPHVPFFKPIVEQLEKRGHSVVLTARDCFQVCELADLFHMKYKRIGRHYGKHTVAKLAGLGVRALQMAPTVLREKPDLALSHGSRSMFLLSSLLRIPTLTIFDYEHTRWVSMLQPTWVMAPDIVPEAAICSRTLGAERVLRYPGIKEDVYAPSFEPDPNIREKLGVAKRDLVITFRPPATEAHYHNPESEILQDAVFDFLSQLPETKVILVPRTPKQGAEIRERRPKMFESGQMRIPEHVFDGLDLIWTSDLVISGGGTMNREAAALGIPVYSIFRGTIGAVDRYLAAEDRLVLIETVEDVKTKINVVRRAKSTERPASDLSPARDAIVENILYILDHDSAARQKS